MRACSSTTINCWRKQSPAEGKLPGTVVPSLRRSFLALSNVHTPWTQGIHAASQ